MASLPLNRPAHSRAGFTLLEAVIALAILGTGVATVLGLLATGVSVTQRTSARVLAAELAEEHMEGLLLLPHARLLGSDGAAGAFAPPYEDFRWRTRIGRGSAAGLVQVEVMVVGQGDSVHLATLARPG